MPGGNLAIPHHVLLSLELLDACPEVTLEDSVDTWLQYHSEQPHLSLGGKN